jgi:phosphoribosylamine--glycine ligase
MKILVAGGGGREHSLVWKIAQSPHEEVIAAADEYGMTMKSQVLGVDRGSVDGFL